MRKEGVEDGKAVMHPRQTEKRQIIYIYVYINEYIFLYVYIHIGVAGGLHRAGGGGRKLSGG